MALEITSANPVVKAVIEGSAPRPALLAASRGVLPLPQADLLEILVHFAEGSDAELKENAKGTLTTQQPESIQETIRSNTIAPGILSYFAKQPGLPPSVHETIILNPATPPQALVQFARETQSGSLLELISFNQQLLIQNPAIIDAILAHAARTEETEEQRQASIGKILGELKMEAGDELTTERVSMINRVMKMSVKDRVKLGMKGDREARNILIRDPNRLVSSAVVNNPRITEQEIEMISGMRSIPEEILRQVAANRLWSRNYNIVHSLARNPRTPMANVLTILSRLQLRDLVALSKNRNVSDAVRRQALRLHTARTGGKKSS